MRPVSDWFGCLVRLRFQLHVADMDITFVFIMSYMPAIVSNNRTGEKIIAI